jgi:uncharacterized phage-associated protein
MYNEQKAAQIAAWFIAQEGGTMPHLKLMKLMYLADREAMRTCGFPITGDRFVSMPHGPVLVNTLNHINDDAFSVAGGWDDWISDKANYEVALLRQATPETLDHLSRADLQVLQDIWSKFGHMTKYQIRDYTHDPLNCPEWKDPHGSSNPIAYKEVFEALGFQSDLAAGMAAEIEAQNTIAQALAAPIAA